MADEENRDQYGFGRIPSNVGCCAPITLTLTPTVPSPTVYTHTRCRRRSPHQQIRFLPIRPPPTSLHPAVSAVRLPKTDGTSARRIGAGDHRFQTRRRDRLGAQHDHRQMKIRVVEVLGALASSSAQLCILGTWGCPPFMENFSREFRGPPIRPRNCEERRP